MVTRSAAIATIRRSDQVLQEPVSAEMLQNLYTMDSHPSPAPMPEDDSNINWLSEQDDCPTLLQDSFQPLDPAELLPPDIDKESLVEGSRILERAITTPLCKSRVVGDIWQLMDRLPLSKSHGIRKIFARALRDSILLIEPDDQERVTTYLQQIGTTWEERLRTNPKCILARVRRSIPDPETLYESLKWVFCIRRDNLRQRQEGHFFHHREPGMKHV
ncbi:hypothetical protein V1524DRAFT_411529 [Lipomyces starkeyi]